MSFNIIDSKNSLTQLFNSIQRSPGEISIIENFLYPIESWPENLESWAQIEHQNQKLIFKDLNQFKQIESIKIEQETKNDILALNLSEYLILYKNNPDFYQKLRCSEGLLPSSFAEKLKDRIVDSDFINSINDQYSKEYYYRFFLARENSITETHLDWVSHTNLLFQIFGRKRVFIFRPELCLHLPMTNNLVNLKLENVLSVARKMDMICGEIVLERGQGVVIPPYHLHAVLYEENAASLALRVLPLKKNWTLA